MRQINDAGLRIIKDSEGLRLTAYRDIAGIWTIGWGHTPAWANEVISMERANALLLSDISGASKSVDAATHDVETTDNQFSAMVSLTFNIGIGGFKGSTVLREHRAGNHVAAADAFLKWNKAHVNGKLVVVKGLTTRREKERALYLAA